jgi:hypothetical protein
MEKYIKLNGEQIVEVRPLLEEPTEELLERFEREFIRLDVPDVGDMELLTGYIYKNNKFTKTSVFKEQFELGVELDEIRNWFSENDWIPNKIIVGEWETTDQRWLDYLEERATKRTRQDEIVALLKEIS